MPVSMANFIKARTVLRKLRASPGCACLAVDHRLYALALSAAVASGRWVRLIG
jgi:hypothetical protein